MAGKKMKHLAVLNTIEPSKAPLSHSYRAGLYHTPIGQARCLTSLRFMARARCSRRAEWKMKYPTVTAVTTKKESDTRIREYWLIQGP
ncbi:hypothetical protein JZ751_025458 [Albula glossodonta]|uniref:Uncharacterized protein n=1 Tax=Albula glossodonta TaxID=121402 RepID=A0A8T2NH50_9TELE|nr:hypothetical protein JZ751_025458 [Albula glossodonta]